MTGILKKVMHLITIYYYEPKKTYETVDMQLITIDMSFNCQEVQSIQTLCLLHGIQKIISTFYTV